MDELKKFSQAILGGIASAQNAPGIAGISDANNRAFASRLRSPLVERSAGVGQFAGQVAENEAAQAEASRRKRLQELQDMMDPGKYERRRKDDGGFSFYDPTGKEIGIDMYTKRTGLRAADVLKDSDNPIDQQYVSDYMNMNKLMQAAFNGETDEVNTILEKNNLSKDTKPESYMQQLIKRYPHIYGVGPYEASRRNLNKPVFSISSKWFNQGGDTKEQTRQMILESLQE